MEHLLTRLDALEQQVQTLTQHTRTATTHLRWWRGIACSLMVLGLLGWGLPVGLAREDGAEKDTGEKGLAQRVAALEKLLKHVSREKNEIFITGANLHIVNGIGSTDCTGEQFEPIPDCPNGLGNLIVGYNEPREGEENIRTGSHNVVVGQQHNFSRFGGLVVGDLNAISGDFAVVSGGQFNTASGGFAAVSGGIGNTASGDFAAVSGSSANTASGFSSVVSGGVANTASGDFAVVSGGGDEEGVGLGNTASGSRSMVSGGTGNTASGDIAWVSGGRHNTASGNSAVVSGGQENTASGFSSMVSGGFVNTASGDFAVVNGGRFNTASGDTAVVSGGQNITQETEFGWSAGSEAEEVVVGNFRSP